MLYFVIRVKLVSSKTLKYYIHSSCIKIDDKKLV